jgi:transposase InsO family protein
VAPKAVMTMSDWRLEVLLEPERTGKTVTEVCQRHEISRDTFYRWKRRFEAAGIAGLLERSREPSSQPGRIRVELEGLVCQMRDDNPHWGARTIRARLKRAGVAPPAVSTIHRVLVRNNKVSAEPSKRPKSSYRRFQRDEPNDMWQMDATMVVLNDKTQAWVVDVLDDHARFLLSALAVEGATQGVHTWAAFETAARAYGLPKDVFTDNHLTFTGRLKGIEVDFEQRLRRIGVRHICGRPRYPQSKGKIERFHRTLKEWIARQGGADHIEHLQRLLDEFRTDYNTDRPHQSLDDATPAERYRSSMVTFRGDVIVDPIYPQGTVLRRASRLGTVDFDRMRISLGVIWARQLMAVGYEGKELVIRHGDEVVRRLIPDKTRYQQSLPKKQKKLA